MSKKTIKFHGEIVFDDNSLKADDSHLIVDGWPFGEQEWWVRSMFAQFLADKLSASTDPLCKRSMIQTPRGVVAHFRDTTIAATDDKNSFLPSGVQPTSYPACAAPVISASTTPGEAETGT